MNEHTTTKIARKKPGPVFFMVAMFFYLLLVHVLSLLSTGTSGAAPLDTEIRGVPPFMASALDGFHELLGGSRGAFHAFGLVLLYGCMLCIFQLTRRIAKGPVWLGSLAAVVFMAHPVKTEVLFSMTGFYHLLAACAALMAVLVYLRLAEAPSAARYVLALALFALASFPFPINAALFGVLVLLEFYPGTPESRRWHRLVPFVTVTVVANGLHLETLYARLPDFEENLGPLVLLVYPIGLLPTTVSAMHATPAAAWLWGIGAFALLVAAMAFVKNGAFRVCVLAVLSFRFYPGAEVIDLSSMAGGAQLLFPLALSCIAFAGFCRWLQKFEAWGKPTVVLTSMLCVVLFVLQFQANRAHALGTAEPATPVEASATPGTEGVPRG